MNVKVFKRNYQIFFIIFCSLFLIGSRMQFVFAAEPTKKIEIAGQRIKTKDGVYVQSNYQLLLQGYDRKKNLATYKIGSYWKFEGRTRLYSDLLYVNGKYVGTFSGNNGYHNAGIIQRNQWFTIQLHAGRNIIETKNENGVGGESYLVVVIPEFRAYDVIFQDDDGSVLKIEEVEKGGCAKPPKDPQKNGYTFAGWDKAFCNVQSDLIVSATYQPWKHIVRYQAQDATNIPQEQTKIFKQDLQLSNQIPKKQGYTFSKWKKQGSNRYYKPNEIYQEEQNGGVVIMEAIWDNHNPQLIIPVEKENGSSQYQDIPPYIEGNKIIVQKGDKINPLDFVSAYDKEDGDLSNQVKIEKDPIIRDKEGYTTEAGEFIVEVSVKDQAQAITKGVVVVIVNDPPILQGEDRYFFVDEEITDAMLLQKVKAFDKEDKDLSKQVVIASHNIKPHVQGDYDITYEVVDSYQKKVKKSYKIHILENINTNNSKRYLRFINSNYLNTLKANSIWRNDRYATLLSNSLYNKNESTIWKITKKDFEQIKKFNALHDYSQESNQLFYETFQFLIQRR